MFGDVSSILFCLQTVLEMLNCQLNGKKPGVMIPIPQYPLYSATLTEFDMYQVCLLLVLGWC